MRVKWQKSGRRKTTRHV